MFPTPPSASRPAYSRLRGRRNVQRTSSVGATRHMPHCECGGQVIFDGVHGYYVCTQCGLVYQAQPPQPPPQPVSGLRPLERMLLRILTPSARLIYARLYVSLQHTRYPLYRLLLLSIAIDGYIKGEFSERVVYSFLPRNSASRRRIIPVVEGIIRDARTRQATRVRG